MYTYVQRPECKKENTGTYVYIRAGSRTPTRAYVRPGLMYMAGSEWRNIVLVVFMERQRNASCSWGGNGMRCVHREGLDRTCDGNEAWRTVEQRKRTSYVRNGVLLIGSGVAYRKTDKMDILQSKRGSC